MRQFSRIFKVTYHIAGNWNRLCDWFISNEVFPKFGFNLKVNPRLSFEYPSKVYIPFERYTNDEGDEFEVSSYFQVNYDKDTELPIGDINNLFGFIQTKHSINFQLLNYHVEEVKLEDLNEFMVNGLVKVTETYKHEVHTYFPQNAKLVNGAYLSMQ